MLLRATDNKSRVWLLVNIQHMTCILGTEHWPNTEFMLEVFVLTHKQILIYFNWTKIEMTKLHPILSPNFNIKE